MTAAMAFGAVAPALALDDNREVSAGRGTDVVAGSAANAGAGSAEGAEVGTQGRKWGFPWW
ncbi:hypothetical protein AB0K14_21230 [Actinosynnema sp. NPDC050801]|uniref:hypothetical protein n=1 Tax=unclassified Actinosynnema TaxID=2637065 RepID=UPI0033EA20CB